MALVNAQQKITIRMKWRLSRAHTFQNRWQFNERFVLVATASQTQMQFIYPSHWSNSRLVNSEFVLFLMEIEFARICWNEVFSVWSWKWGFIPSVLCEWQRTRLWQLRCAHSIVGQFPWCNVWYCQTNRSGYIQSTNYSFQFCDSN